MIPTFDQVKAALLQVAEANPDRVQPRYTVDGLKADRLTSNAGCRYTGPDGLPSCIIGHAADVLGVPRPRWGDPENRGSIGEVLPVLEADALILAGRVQARADLGDAWGDVVPVIESARSFR